MTVYAVKPSVAFSEVSMAAASVMIIDDDTDIRRVVRLMLTKAGYQVVEASDGEAEEYQPGGGHRDDRL